MTPRIIDQLQTRARAHGFVAVGVALVRPMDPSPLVDWLDAGHGAEMTFLRRHAPLRADLAQVMPGARSVICVAMPYPEPEGHGLPEGLVARYARGRDYHDVLRERLHALWDDLGIDAEGRIFVDSGPLPERELARRAGVGWVGKNACLIVPGIGSRVVLGEILTTADLPPTALVAGDCGDCRRCLAACPTAALVAPGVVDARRCLSYLTIEQRGPIPEDLRPLMGTHLFGCDACQDACPHNSPATPLSSGRGAGGEGRAGARNDTTPSLTPLLALTEETFRARFRNTPILRAKCAGLLRNACIVLGNLGDPAAIPALTRAANDPDPLVREHAAWALERL
jgi:epoxyqueuosine reductase